MRIVCHGHAFDHGLSKAQIASAYETGANGAVIRSRDRKADPARWATIGFDIEAREIELVFVKLADDAVLIIHANYLTREFRTEIRKANHGLHRR